MENLGAMAYSRYTGFREITDRDVLELHCMDMVAILFNSVESFEQTVNIPMIEGPI